MNRSTTQNIFTLLLFIVLGAFIYSNTLEVPFLFDDLPRIRENPYIRINELTIDNLLHAAFNKQSSISRPIGNITFALNYYFHQFDLKGYHLFNIIIHILTAIFFYFLVKTTLRIPLLSSRYDRPEVIAFLTALIWLVHPLQTESVTYIVQRLNSMAAMFYVLSLLLYVKGRLAIEKRKSHMWYIGSALACILALGSKQNAAMLPFFILLYEWYFFQDLDRAWLKRHLIYVVGVVALFCLVALLYLGTSPLEKLKSITDFAHHEFTLTERILTQFRVVIYYLSLLIYPNPSRLNLDYDFPLSHSLVDPASTLLCLGLLVGVLALAVYLAKKERLLSFCILWFFGNLVIESSVIPLAVIYEHRTYLPSMFICLLAVALGYRYIKVKWLGIALVCIVVAVFSSWTYQRNGIWSDPIAFWTDCVKKSPKKSRPHINLGAVLENQGRIEEAVDQYLQALRIKPDFAEAHFNLGHALAKQGRIEEAIDHYSQCLKIQPNSAKAHNNLGILLADQGRLDEATDQYLQALKIKPDFADAHNNLGIVLADRGRLDEAIDQYLQALKIKPDFADAHFNLGNALITQKGITDSAIRHFTEALRLNPKFVKAANSLAVALIGTGKFKEAVAHLREALRIDPNMAATYLNLGIALMLQDKSDEAFYYFNKALQINPDIPEAHVNLGIILFNKERFGEAVAHFRKALQIDPGNNEALFNLNKTLATLKEIDLNIEKFQKDLALNPKDPLLNFQLGNMYRTKGDSDKAIAYYQKATSFKPDFPEALYHLAKLYIRRHEYNKAQILYQKIIDLLPDNPAVYYNIACLYANQNKPEESIAWLKKALEKGFNDWNQIKTDSDLDTIRNSSQYEAFVKGH